MKIHAKKTILLFVVLLLGGFGAAYWFSDGKLDRFMMLSGVVYGAIIVVFLAATLWAFVWAHIEYREDLEAPKFSLFDIEKNRK